MRFGLGDQFHRKTAGQYERDAGAKSWLVNGSLADRDAGVLESLAGLVERLRAPDIEGEMIQPSLIRSELELERGRGASREVDVVIAAPQNIQTEQVTVESNRLLDIRDAEGDMGDPADEQSSALLVGGGSNLPLSGQP